MSEARFAGLTESRIAFCFMVTSRSCVSWGLGRVLLMTQLTIRHFRTISWLVGSSVIVYATNALSFFCCNPRLAILISFLQSDQSRLIHESRKSSTDMGRMTCTVQYPYCKMQPRSRKKPKYYVPSIQALENRERNWTSGLDTSSTVQQSLRGVP